MDAGGRPQILFSGADVTERKREREQLRASRARIVEAADAARRRIERDLEMLAVRSPVPVEIERAPAERLPEQVEAAIYYVVAEALTNVAKYAHANTARVTVSQVNADGKVIAACVLRWQ